MIFRAAGLAAGILAAVVTSQFPEFSQQYYQRLGGAVDALAEVVDDFDASAQAAGLGRDEALSQMQGTDFLERRRTDMTRAINRYETLQGDLSILEGHGPFMRAYHLPRLTDPQIARAAWAVYQPAMPLNLPGALFAGLGFGLGWGVTRALFGLLRWPFARRKLA